MATKDEPVKRKLPHTAQDIQHLEDEIAKLAGDLREIRSGMTERQLDAVELKAGTFRFYLAKMRQIAKDFKGEFESQLIEMDVRKSSSTRRQTGTT